MVVGTIRPWKSGAVEAPRRWRAGPYRRMPSPSSKMMDKGEFLFL
jgi:hypothetical protein